MKFVRPRDVEDFAPSDECRTEVPESPGDYFNDKRDPSPGAAAAAALTIAKSTRTAVSHQAGESVEVTFQQDREPEITKFKDHFTLLIPSSTIRYRDLHAAARVLEGPDAQFVIEETYDADKEHHEVSIRRITDSNAGVQFLRISYAIVTAFWTGFLFVFFLQILLFLFLDLAILAGATSKQGANWGKALGAVLAFPGFVHGLSSALVIAGAYIMDTWRGHYLIRNFTFKNMRKATVEWIFFVFFLGLPIFVLCCTLISKVDNWWEITTLVWFSCVAAFYVLFAANVVFYEMRACWEVTQNTSTEEVHSWFGLIRRSILSRQIHQYSGRKTFSFLAMGSITDSEYTDTSNSSNRIESTSDEHISILAKFTQWGKFEQWGCYENVADQEERIYSIDDARDVRPYMTSYTWSLEKVFCRRRNSRYVAIIRGPGALTQSQLRSSLICSIVGIFLIFFLFFSFLIYVGLGAIFTVSMLAIGSMIAYPSLKNTYKLYSTREDLMAAKEEAEKEESKGIHRKHDDEAGAGLVDRRGNKEESECVYFQSEVYRITRPTVKFCWFMFALEVTTLFLYPLSALYAVGNYPLATMFVLFAGLPGLRYYVNAAVVLEETGRMDLVDGETELELWRKQSRLNEIVGNITVGRSLKTWRSVLAALGLIFLALMLGAVGRFDREVNEIPKIFLNNYEYVQADSLRYPTCQLSNDLGDSPLVTMADYAFLAGLAYRSPNIAQQELNGWFGGEAIDQEATVKEFREIHKTSSAVSFKLVTFPSFGNFGYVLIRGTQNPWDMLTDAQLWSAAAFMQVHRELLPFGKMWSAIIDQLIQAITAIESEGINKVSFYRDTTFFVNFLKAQPSKYAGVGVTGHSLGGGLSIITGAQTGVPAVALSAPNAMLSRQSFDPPVTREQLNSKTFNIIPNRDIVPMVDDVAMNFQKIRCEAGFSDVIGCHSAVRSLCEIMFSCGTNDRPFLCACVTEFGYPEPTLKEGVTSTQTFAEACGLD